ncbi:MAG: serine protease, partial [Solirubrobacteraceae bacterium]
MRKSLLAAAAAGALLGATPAHAIVGGGDAAPGEFPAVAEIILGKIAGCTGTLIAPQWVMTAGHCGSLTGGTIGVAQPVAKFPPQLIDVRIGNTTSGQGGVTPAVDDVVVEPDYLLTDSYDVTLLHLAVPVAGIAPVQIASTAERAIWEPGDLQTIAGWGVTEEGGDAPTTLQKAQVPVTTDAYCENAYGGQEDYLDGSYGFENRTQVCAGFPEGGVDSCQGDSGGPLFAANPEGVLRLTGATSYGDGCAQAGKPGVYARVADTELRNWIGSVAPGALAGYTESVARCRAIAASASAKAPST